MKTSFFSFLACVLTLALFSGCGSDEESAPMPDSSIDYLGGVDAKFEPALKSNLAKLMRANPELAGIETVLWETTKEISYLGKVADQVIFRVTIDGSRYKGDATFLRGADGPEFDGMNIEGPEGLKYL